MKKNLFVNRNPRLGMDFLRSHRKKTPKEIPSGVHFFGIGIGTSAVHILSAHFLASPPTLYVTRRFD